MRRDPGATAVISAEGDLTYAALDEHANRLAHRLRKLGVRPEARVGLCLQQSTEMIVGILGILKAGGAYVPLDPDSPAERLDFLLRDAGIGVVVTQQNLRGRLTDRIGRIVCLDIEGLGRNDLADCGMGVTPASFLRSDETPKTHQSDDCAQISRTLHFCGPAGRLHRNDRGASLILSHARNTARRPTDI